MSRSHHTWTVVLAVISLVAACSGDDGGSSPTSGPATEPTTTVPARVSFESNGDQRDGWFWLDGPEASARWEVVDVPAGAATVPVEVRAAADPSVVDHGVVILPLTYGRGDFTIATLDARLVARRASPDAQVALATTSLDLSMSGGSAEGPVWVQAAQTAGVGVKDTSLLVGSPLPGFAGTEVAAALPPPDLAGTRLDGEFVTSGDEISGWWWVRDGGYRQYARWRFPSVPNLDKGVTVQLHVLATDGFDGRAGLDANFYLSYGFVTSLEGTDQQPADAWGGTLSVTVPNVSPEGDPVGYTTQDSFDLTFENLPVEAVGLWFEVTRDHPDDAGPPATNHVAFNAASLGLLVNPIGGDTTDGGSSQLDGGGPVDPDADSDADTMDDADANGDLPPGSLHGALGTDDADDWFGFQVADDQIIDVQVTTDEALEADVVLFDPLRNRRAPSASQELASGFSFTADVSGRWYVHVARLGSTAGAYTLRVTVSDPNDAFSGTDAGDSAADALAVPNGQFTGLVQRADPADHYAVEVAAGEIMTVTLEPLVEGGEFEVELRESDGTTVGDEIAYGAEVSVFAPAGAARALDLAVTRSSGDGGVYLLRLIGADLGECAGQQILPAAFTAAGSLTSSLTPASEGWFWLGTGEAARRTQFGLWTFDQLPEGSSVRVFVDLPAVPARVTDDLTGDVGTITPRATAIWVSWGVDGGPATGGPQLVTLPVVSRAGSATGFAAVGEVDVPHGQLSSAQGSWWLRMTTADPAGAVAPTDLGVSAGSFTLCADAAVGQLDGLAGTVEPPPLSVVYDGDTKELQTDGSIFVDPATDPDHDGLSQSFEDQAVALATPVLELDDDELWLDMPGNHPTVNFAQATLWPSAWDPQWVVIGYLSTWAYDPGGGDEFFQSNLPLVGVRENHRGDSERIWEAWQVVDDQHVRLVWVATSAHAGITDHSALWKVGETRCNTGNVAAVDTSGTPAEDWHFEQQMCADLEFDESGRLVIYPSQDKHAMYPSRDVCESVALAAHAATGVPFWGEDCGWDPLFGLDLTDDDPNYLGDGRWQFESFNVGEPGFALIDDLDTPAALTALSADRADLLSGGYPNEAVWSGHTGGHSFCGGFDQGDVVDMSWPRGDITMPDACSTRLGVKFTEWPADFLEVLAAVGG